jgi:hypothetical protein
MSTKVKRIKYSEGQWFMVPLLDEGYALGIIVRGNYKTWGGLGYFWEPKYQDIPDESVIWHAEPSNALLIAWFSDIEIGEGKWPLMNSSRPFSRQYWPVPEFKRIDLLHPTMGYKTTYSQDDTGKKQYIKEERMKIELLSDLFEDGSYGAEALRIKLTKILSGKVN